MKDQSSTTYATTASRLTELVQDGPMTVEIYMECIHLLGLLLRSSARTTDEITSLGGSKNSTSKSPTQEEASEPSSTNESAQPKAGNNTPLSHSGCWCNSSKKQGIHNV